MGQAALPSVSKDEILARFPPGKDQAPGPFER